MNAPPPSSMAAKSEAGEAGIAKTASRATFFRQSGWMMLATIIGGMLMWSVHLLSRAIPASEYGTLITLFAVVNLIPTMPLQMVFTQQPPDEMAEEEDPRWELVRQLIEYKKFKDAAAHLQNCEAAQENLFTRLPEKPDLTAERPIGEVTIFDLINAFNNVLKRLNTTEDLREIFEENYSVSDKIDLIMKMTSSGVALKFSELFAHVASRTEVVVTFLALLELIRLKQIRCLQPETFGEIEIVGAEGRVLA